MVAVPNNVRTQLLYYVRHPTEIVDEPRALGPVLAKNAEVWVLAPESVRGAIGRFGTVEVVDRSAGVLGHHDEEHQLTLLRLRADAS